MYESDAIVSNHKPPANTFTMIKPFFLLYTLFLIAFASCKPSVENTVPLPLLDISKDYSVKKVNLHDIADVEYIPLETTTHSLLTNDCSSFYISDKYIITRGMQSGEIFFFDRSGKHLKTINRRGEGNEEYACIILLAIDFISEECFVSDGTDRILVYSFSGEYLRRLPIPTKTSYEYTALFNYDKEYLIGYCGSYVYDTQTGENKKPYCLINKQTGKQYTIDFTARKHISPRVHEEMIPLPGVGAYAERVHFPMTPLIKNGSEFLIADFASDTLFCFVGRKLTPIAAQTPTVYVTDFPLVIAPMLLTDQYFSFKVISMRFDPSDPMKYYHKALQLVWDRRTGEIERWKVYDPNLSSDLKVPSTFLQSFDGSNYGISWRDAEFLQEQYAAGKLSGKLKEIAAKLKIDDNNVLIICKYK